MSYIEIKEMRYLKLLVLILLIGAGSCIDSGDPYYDDGTSVACRQIIRKDACGTTDIGNNLPWLHSIILTSYSDQTGVYRGKIWCRQYNGTDYVVTDMPLIPGNTGFHVFTCDGQETTINDGGFFSTLTAGDILWVSYCATPGTTE